MRFAAFDEGVIDVINIDSGQTIYGKTHNRLIKRTVNCLWLYQSCGSTLFVVLTFFEALMMSRKHQKSEPNAVKRCRRHFIAATGLARRNVECDTDSSVPV